MITETKSAEQQARDMLERMGVEGAQSMSAGDVAELANLIATAERLRGASFGFTWEMVQALAERVHPSFRDSWGSGPSKTPQELAAEQERIDKLALAALDHIKALLPPRY